ncbi:MAG: S8 family serine peptidase [Planctomycetota bacterium]
MQLTTVTSGALGVVCASLAHAHARSACSIAAEGLRPPGETVAGIDEAAPDDPLFPEQWSLSDFNGVSSGQAIPDVRAFEFWNTLESLPDSTEADPIVIAVLDAGLDPDHPDLQGTVLPGRNFAGGAIDDVSDTVNSHGTAVAGLIAAPRNDGNGIAGLLPQAQIIPVRIVTSFGFSMESWAAEGLVWAVDEGADVVVMPLSFPTGGKAFRDAVLYAYDHGVVLVASTGNDGSDSLGYPAAWPEVIAVGASDREGDVPPFSVSGSGIDLVAPGVDLICPHSGSEGLGVHRVETGTSFAAPLVAAAAGGILSVSPSFSPDAVRTILRETATDIGENGWDELSGAGRLDAAEAISMAFRISTCPADQNLDGYLSGSDFNAWVSAFIQENPIADVDHSGDLSSTDFTVWLQSFLEGCDASAL